MSDKEATGACDPALTPEYNRLLLVERVRQLGNELDAMRAANAALRAFAQKILTEYPKVISIAVIAKECGLLRVDGDGQSEWIFNCLRPTPLLTGEQQA